MERKETFPGNSQRAEKAGELGKAPYSVGVDTWGVDYVLLDEKDEPIGGVYCYRDGRTKSAVASVHRRVPFAGAVRKDGDSVSGV